MLYVTSGIDPVKGAAAGMLPSHARMAVALLMFAALVLAGALHLLAASGHFPREHRDVQLRSALGRFVLFGSIAVTSVCVPAGTVAAFRLIPWSFVIIAAGLAILAAPLA